MKKDNYRIFVSNHIKDVSVPNYVKERKDNFYYVTFPIATISNVNNVSIDLSKDSIFERNKFYSEFAQMYYVWKNIDLSGIKYIGFSHYRRLFPENVVDNLDEIFNNGNKVIVISPGNREIFLNEFDNNVYDKNVLPNIENIYIKHGINLNDFLKTHFLYSYTMFITDKNNFYNYCEWIYPILLEVEKETLNGKTYDEFIKEDSNKIVFPEWANFQRYIRINRFVGCIGEKLTNYYIIKNFKDNEIYKTNYEGL